LDLVPTVAAFLRHVAAAYPDAETISVALDTWPLHHPTVAVAVATARIARLVLPADAL